MHGNELRKADHPAAAIARLGRAIEVSTDREGRGAAYALLARAAGERRDPHLFDHAINGYRDLLDSGSARGMLFNPFTFREIQLRGLISTGRPSIAARIMETGQPDALPAAPQWHIIERVTAGQVLLAAGKRDEAKGALHAALTSAESHRLPHQIQRSIRTANDGGLTDISDVGDAALKRLNDLLRPVLSS
jgi:hypothetical protein